MDLEHFLHLHLDLTNKARKIHRTGIIVSILGRIYGVENSKDVEEVCVQ